MVHPIFNFCKNTLKSAGKLAGIATAGAMLGTTMKATVAALANIVAPDSGLRAFVGYSLYVGYVVGVGGGTVIAAHLGAKFLGGTDKVMNLAATIALISMASIYPGEINCLTEVALGSAAAFFGPVIASVIGGDPTNAIFPRLGTAWNVCAMGGVLISYSLLLYGSVAFAKTAGVATIGAIIGAGGAIGGAIAATVEELQPIIAPPVVLAAVPPAIGVAVPG